MLVLLLGSPLAFAADTLAGVELDAPFNSTGWNPSATTAAAWIKDGEVAGVPGRVIVKTCGQLANEVVFMAAPHGVLCRDAAVKMRDGLAAAGWTIAATIPMSGDDFIGDATKDGLRRHVTLMCSAAVKGTADTGAITLNAKSTSACTSGL